MINRVSSKFSIKDLQNISGIKIPTIRMWEKRYTVFKPQRTATNIRYYNSHELRKIMNIALLQKQGHKISKLAALTDQELADLVKELHIKQEDTNTIINEFLLCMFNFDKVHFHKLYTKLSEQYPFKEIFIKFFIPLLEKIGLLWQTSSLNPVQEHFLSNLILQKLYTEIDAATQANHDHKSDSTDKLYILYLPNNEIHELGILFVYYNLLLEGKHVIYLGQNVSIDELQNVLDLSQRIIFISNFTVAPLHTELENYFSKYQEKLLQNENRLLVSGYQVSNFIDQSRWRNISIHTKLQEVLA